MYGPRGLAYSGDGDGGSGGGGGDGGDSETTPSY